MSCSFFHQVLEQSKQTYIVVGTLFYTVAVVRKVAVHLFLVVLLVLPLFSAWSAITVKAQPPVGVDAMAVWMHWNETKNEFDPWYSLYDEKYGEWWTPAGPQAAPITEMLGNDTDPNVAFDPATYRALVVWAHQSQAGYDIWFALFDPYEVWWVNIGAVAEIEGEDLDPDVAFDTNGYAICTWVHKFANGTQVIYYSVWNGTTWIGPNVALVPLPDNWPGYAGLPEICFTNIQSGDPNAITPHEAVTVWSDINYTVGNYTVFYSIWRGSRWTNQNFATTVESIPGQTIDVERESYPDFYAHGRMGISADRLGHAKVVYSEPFPIGWGVFSSEWFGASSKWAFVDTRYGWGWWPAVAFNWSNHAVSTYFDVGTLTYDIMYRVEFNYDWIAMQAIASDSGWDDYRPAIAAKPGAFVNVWYANDENVGDFEIYWSEFNGTAWMPPAMLFPAGLPGDDLNPEIATPIFSPTTPVVPEFSTLVLLLSTLIVVVVGVVKVRRG